MKPNFKHIVIWTGLIAAILTAGLPATAAAQPQTILKVDPQSLRLQVGETAQVDLTLEQVADLYGAEIHLRFNPEILEIVDADPAQEGVQLEPGMLPIPDFVVLNKADNVAGTVDYAVTQLPPNKPGEGDGIVARITFRAKKAAVSQIQLERFLLADTSGSSIQAVPQHGQIKVTGNSTWILITIASALLMVIGGGIGFIWIKRK